MTGLLQRSLFWRLYVVELAAVTLVWLVMGVIVIRDSHRAIADAIDTDLRLLAGSLSTMTTAAPNEDAVRSIAETLRVLCLRHSSVPMHPADFTYQVWKSNGTLIVRSHELPAVDALPPGSLPLGRSQLHQGWMVMAERRDGSDIVAVVGESSSYLLSLRNAAKRKLLYPYLILAAALAAVVWLALHVGLQPLRRFSMTVLVRKHGDITPFSTVGEYLELRPLVSALNETLARIQSMRQAERDFFADAAHELRTPLAAIAAQAHVVANEREESSRQAATKALNEGIERAANVLRRLLLLARMDAASFPYAMELVDLARLVEEVVDARERQARTTGHALVATCVESIDIRCDESYVRVMLDSLIDNALKYTPAGTRIHVTARLTPSECVLSVIDDGPGIPTEFRERVFHRFERLDGSDSEGTGLGLAIVQRVAELHGGRVILGDGENRCGCRFDIYLPR